jgi:hypothetical protein
MFGFQNDHWAQAKELFERQFESDGDHFLYRRSQKGAPIRVSPDERGRFIDEYAGRLRLGSWGMAGGLTLGVALAVWWSLETGFDVPEAAIYIGTGAVAAILMGYILWAWGAPARELARRTPVGRARTRAEVSRAWLGNMTYGRLLGVATGGILACLVLAAKDGGFSGWGRLWIVFAVVTAVGAAIQACRKWRFEQEDMDRT